MSFAPAVLQLSADAVQPTVRIRDNRQLMSFATSNLWLSTHALYFVCRLQRALSSSCAFLSLVRQAFPFLCRRSDFSLPLRFLFSAASNSRYLRTAGFPDSEEQGTLFAISLLVYLIASRISIGPSC